MKIKRGDIYFVKTEVPNKPMRPAIVVSNNLGNTHSNFVEIVYLTTKTKSNLPTHVKIKCKRPSTALCENIVSLHKNKLKSYVRSCSDSEMKCIDKSILLSLGIERKDTNVSNNRR